jgi:non-ribosomal peptide synthetase component F
MLAGYVKRCHEKALSYELDPRPLESLRYVIFGGQAVDKPSVRKWLSLRGGREQLINMYGITETTVHATVRGRPQ